MRLIRPGKFSGAFALVGLVITAMVIASLALANPGIAAPGVPLRDGGPAQVGFGGVYIKSHRVNISIDNQIATTKIEQVFVNEGGGLAEGQYLFPLPIGAAVSDLTLYIDGVAIKGQILDAKQAQQIYTEIVRRSRDPVLLQYVGRSAIQANIFPIPAGQERKIEITYSHIITSDSGLLNYVYPLRTDYASKLPVREVSVSLTAKSKDPISTVYSPNARVIVSRIDDFSFRAGFEAYNYYANDDFSVYYAVANKEINASLLTYRGSATEDGFYMLMITPPTTVDASRVIPKDVIVVLDQSGSMGGEKWEQARAAVRYVLRNLNPQDRFNVVAFSTGYRVYARSPQPVAEAEKAIEWINGLEALGGTDINGGLTTALQSADKERQTTLLFLTDGLPTEGVTDAKGIIANVKAAIGPNTRVFSFGVGNDVDTILLDTLSSSYGGTSVYVRPNENIEQAVTSLYRKITSPVLTAIKLSIDGAPILEDSYPQVPLPDLFAGTQLIVVGRFRGEGTATVTLTGLLNGENQTFTYPNLAFPANAGGQPFIARLWATRKIGFMLNQIRLNGETRELVESVVQLSVRYGIITPYTSFLIQEDDIRAQGGEQQPGRRDLGFAMTATAPAVGFMAPPATQASGQAAVDKAREANEKAGADAVAPPESNFGGGQGGGDRNGNGPMAPAASPPPGTQIAQVPKTSEEPKAGSARPGEVIKQINDRTFVLRNGVWVDTLYVSDKIKLVPVIFLSDEYFKLLEEHPEVKDYLALGDRLIVMVGDTAYEIKPS